MAEIIRTEIRESDGHEIAFYDSGLQRDVTDNKIIRGPDSAIFSPANASQMNKRRYELARQAAEESIDEAATEAIASGKISISGAGDNIGWRVLNKKAAKTAIESSNSRGLAEILNFLGKSTGYNAPDEPGPTNNTTNVYYFPPDVAKFLTDLRHLLQPSQPSEIFAHLVDAKFEEGE